MRGHSLSLMFPTAKLTRSLELWEAEVSIVDNKNCDRVFHKKTFYPQVIPLIRKNMICTTNHRENPCYVREFLEAFWQLSFWGASPRTGACFLGAQPVPPYHHLLHRCGLQLRSQRSPSQ